MLQYGYVKGLIGGLKMNNIEVNILKDVEVSNRLYNNDGLWL